MRDWLGTAQARDRATQETLTKRLVELHCVGSARRAAKEQRAPEFCPNFRIQRDNYRQLSSLRPSLYLDAAIFEMNQFLDQAGCGT